MTSGGFFLVFCIGLAHAFPSCASVPSDQNTSTYDEIVYVNQSYYAFRLESHWFVRNDDMTRNLTATIVHAYDGVLCFLMDGYIGCDDDIEWIRADKDAIDFYRINRTIVERRLDGNLYIGTLIVKECAPRSLEYLYFLCLTPLVVLIWLCVPRSK